MLISLLLTLEKEKRERNRKRCRTITEEILTILLVDHSAKVNFVELLFEFIKKGRKDTEKKTNDVIKLRPCSFFFLWNNQILNELILFIFPLE
jgi:hypothetical protein